MGIGAIGDNRSYAITKAGADCFKLWQAAQILNGIVQEGGNRLILIATIFEGDSGDSQQV